MIDGARKPLTLRVLERVPVMLGIFVVAMVVLSVISWSARELGALRLVLLDQADVFEYDSIAYVGIDENGILMESTAAWHRNADRVQWNDQLRCGPEQSIYSTTDTAALDVQKRDRATTRWYYTGATPRSRPCSMRSTITVQIRGAQWSQVIWSEPFIPGYPGP